MRYLSAHSHRRGGDSVDLTPQERLTLQHYGAGLTTEQVAAACALSLPVVRGQLLAVQRKLGAHSKLEAIITACRRRLIPLPIPQHARATPDEHASA